MAQDHTEPTNAPAPVTVRVVGIARGNPGLAGAGIEIAGATSALSAPSTPALRVARYLGSAGALDAQMQALALALRYARPLAPAPLRLVLGNETVVRQLNGEHPARHPAVLRALAEVADLLEPFAGASYELGHGDELAEAERLANLGIDTRLRPLPAYDPPLPN